MAIWLPMMDLSALFYNKIFLGLERCWCAISARSISTVLWSLLPNAGNALHLSMIVIDWESFTVKDHQLPRRVSEEFISMQHDLALEQMVKTGTVI
jgi:hypothetical protein